MAIKHDISSTESAYGVAFSNAYYRIVSTSILRQDLPQKFMVTIDVSAYATSDVKNNTSSVKFDRYNVDLAAIEATAGDDFLSKCYTWVMTKLPGSAAV
jgi:hypothetical protein